MNIRFVNQLSGAYKLQLTNKLGQLVYNSSIEIDNSNVSRSVKPGNGLVTGNYQLSIITGDGKRFVQQIVFW